ALADEAAQVLVQLADHAPLLQLVDLDHSGQQLEVIAGVARELLERVHVLGEARAPVADPGLQELRPDALVQAHPARDLDHVRAGLLADVGDLVDERDLRRQERVRGELDHLRAGDVGAHQLTRAAAPVRAVSVPPSPPGPAPPCALDSSGRYSSTVASPAHDASSSPTTTRSGSRK